MNNFNVYFLGPPPLDDKRAQNDHNLSLRAIGHNCVCHTLISSGDLCLMTCNFCLVLVRCLAPIIRQFVKFRDMPENKRKY